MSTWINKVRKGDVSTYLSRAMVLTLGVYIFIIPFPYRTALQEICFYSSLGLLVLLWGFRMRTISFKTPLSDPFLLFAIWVFVSLFFSMNKENSFHDYFAYLIKDLTLFFLVYNTFSSRTNFILLTWLLIVSAGLFSIGGMIYFYGLLKMPLETRIGLPEVGLGVNYIGYVTAMAIFFAATQFLHFRTGFGTLIAAISVAGAALATMFTVTKGTMLGFVSLLILLIARKKVFVLVSVIVVLLILAMPVKRMFTTSTGLVDNERPMIWYNYIQMIIDHPIMGIGFGMQTYTPELLNSYEEKYYKLPQAYAPHNTFIDVAVRCGMPGLALFLYILVAFSRTGFSLIQNSQNPFIKRWALCLMALVVSYLIQGFFSDMLLGIQVKYFFILLAMMAILWNWHIEPSTDVA